VASAMGVAGGSDAGIGVQVADIAQQFTRGNISTTGNNLDVAIDGGGFSNYSKPTVAWRTRVRAIFSWTRRAIW